MTETLTPEDLARLRPVDTEDLKFSIAFGLRFSGRKRIRHADDHMANIAADYLVKHLEASGYVILQKPPAPRHRAPDYGPDHSRKV
jgi:hypothetical protein